MHYFKFEIISGPLNEGLVICVTKWGCLARSPSESIERVEESRMICERRSLKQSWPAHLLLRESLRDQVLGVLFLSGLCDTTVASHCSSYIQVRLFRVADRRFYWSFQTRIWVGEYVIRDTCVVARLSLELRCRKTWCQMQLAASSSLFRPGSGTQPNAEAE
jgi:hypothetical protein